MDKLEQLLQLLQAYGTSEYTGPHPDDKEGPVYALKFDLTVFPPDETGEFEVDFSAIEFPEKDDKPNGPN